MRLPQRHSCRVQHRPGSATATRQSIANIVELTRALFGAAVAFAAVVDGDTGELVLKAVSGEAAGRTTGTRLPGEAGIAGWVASRGHAVLVDDPSSVNDVCLEAVSSAGYTPRRIMAAPLVRDGRCLGVIEVLDRDSRPGQDLRDLDLLVLLADQATLSLSPPGDGHRPAPPAKPLPRRPTA